MFFTSTSTSSRCSWFWQTPGRPCSTSAIITPIRKHSGSSCRDSSRRLWLAQVAATRGCISVCGAAPSDVAVDRLNLCLSCDVSAEKLYKGAPVACVTLPEVGCSNNLSCCCCCCWCADSCSWGALSAFLSLEQGVAKLVFQYTLPFVSGTSGPVVHLTLIVVCASLPYWHYVVVGISLLVVLTMPQFQQR